MKNENEIILVVEDDELIISLLESRLSIEGYKIETASDGIEALKKIENNNDISLILLDIMMPEMNGIEVLKELRKKYSLMELPVLMITALDNDQSVIECLELGANDYLKKPFNFSVLLRRIESNIFIKNAHKSLKSKNTELKNDKIYLQNKLGETLNIVQFSNRINNLNYETLLNEAKKFFPILFEAKLFSFFKYDYRNKRLKLLAHNHSEWENMKNPFYVYEDAGIMWEVIRKREPVIVENFSKSKFNTQNFVSKYKNDNIICAPVMVNKQILGVINLNNIANTFMTQDHFATINIVINQFSLAMNNCLLHKKVEQLSVLDDLTQLYNRRYFHKTIRQEIDRVKRYKNNLSIIMIDIDYFKNFNDKYGHDCGDYVLKEIADFIKNAFRNIDIVCRYGGEEFMVILPNTEKNQAFKIAERIRKSISEKIFKYVHEIKHKLTISIGVTEYKDNELLRQFIKRVDEALYLSKQNGRNKVTII
jgi:two-component system, cell cycle response regulator